ncbi:hypothetical protein SAMN05192564_102329 [Paraburkholderia sartisoli]|uniref:Type II toxin-antitoxin system RelE/ParE family toxin n=1 Tax=Paraburkholderia sartisoli TaxID=83784 RepID=A0A1H4CIK7_9BURK|nr:hypothetical protein SAMN05192564_102329 [Paraburkholderia sartisoli]
MTLSRSATTSHWTAHCALSFVRERRERCTGLAKLPFAFPLIPRHEHLGARHRVYGNCQIFYRVAGAEQCIAVHHVIHGARNFAEMPFP